MIASPAQLSHVEVGESMKMAAVIYPRTTIAILLPLPPQYTSLRNNDSTMFFCFVLFLRLLTATEDEGRLGTVDESIHFHSIVLLVNIPSKAC